MTKFEKSHDFSDRIAIPGEGIFSGECVIQRVGVEIPCREPLSGNTHRDDLGVDVPARRH